MPEFGWKFNFFIFTFLSFLLSFNFVFAHCPLCTAGAGVGAIIAKNLGMKSSAIGVFLGAFSVALGWWLANVLMKTTDSRGFNITDSRGLYLRKSVVPLIILISFLSIILPLKLYFYEIGSFYLNLFGDYGTLFNRTYTYDKFLFASIIGGLIILISPKFSLYLTKIRKKNFPFQGLIINFILLILISVIFQLWL